MKRHGNKATLLLALGLSSSGSALAGTASLAVPQPEPLPSADSLRSIPEHLRGSMEKEFRQFLARGLVRPHHVDPRDGEHPYRSFVRLFERKAPDVGDMAPDVPLWDLETKSMVRLGEIAPDLPLLLVFGSYSCPIFRSHLDDLERVAEAYRGQLEIVIVYTLEAHPTDENPYVRGIWLSQVNEALDVRIRQHRSMEERLSVVNNPPPGLETPVRVLVDLMEHIETVDNLADIGSSHPGNNPAWKAYGLLPNSAFLVDTAGRIAFRTAWFDSGPTLVASIWQLQERSRHGQTDVCYLHPGARDDSASESCAP